MDMPSDLPVRSLIDRAATGVAYDPLAAASEHPKFVHHLGSPWFLALTALGVVFGDIGTSPLYASRSRSPASAILCPWRLR